MKQPVCPATSLRLIKQDMASDLSIEAMEAAEAGSFVHAMKLIERAISILTPPQCDLFTNRARIMMLKGDLAAVAGDLPIIESKRCHVETRMNPLLLQELGKGLLAKGDKLKAIRALQIAMAACDGDWCRSSLAQDLQTASK